MSIDDLVERLSEIAGADPSKDPGFTGMNSVRNWLEDGCDPERDILGAAADVMARRKASGVTGPPASLRYFERPIYEARDRRLKGGPERQPAGNGAQPADDMVNRDAHTRYGRLHIYVKQEKWLDNWLDKPETVAAAEAEMAELEAYLRSQGR